MPIPLGLGIAGLGVAGLSAGLGYLSQNQANKQNQKNFEASLAETQRQFDTTLRYNSEQAQVRRLRAAGLNPALTFGNGSSSVSSGSAPTGNAIRPYQPDFSGALNGFLMSSQIDVNKTQGKKNLADADLANQNAAGREIENLYAGTLREQEIFNMRVDARLKSKMLELNELQRRYDSATLRDRIRRVSIDNDYQQALRDSVTISNRYLPERCRAEINKVIADEAAAYMNGNASLRQAHAAIMSATNQQHAFDAQFGGNPQERSRFFRQTLNLLVQKKKESFSQEWRNYMMPVTTSHHGPFGIGESSTKYYHGFSERYVRKRDFNW